MVDQVIEYTISHHFFITRGRCPVAIFSSPLRYLKTGEKSAFLLYYRNAVILGRLFLFYGSTC